MPRIVGSYLQLFFWNNRGRILLFVVVPEIWTERSWGCKRVTAQCLSVSSSNVSLKKRRRTPWQINRVDLQKDDDSWHTQDALPLNSSAMCHGLHGLPSIKSMEAIEFTQLSYGRRFVTVHAIFYDSLLNLWIFWKKIVHYALKYATVLNMGTNANDQEKQISG